VTSFPIFNVWQNKLFLIPPRRSRKKKERSFTKLFLETLPGMTRKHAALCRSPRELLATK
jgi:hypothetical protein